MPPLPQDLHDSETASEEEEEVEDTGLIQTSTAGLDTVTPATELMSSAMSSLRRHTGEKYGRQPSSKRRRSTPVPSDGAVEPEIPDSEVRASPTLFLRLEAKDDTMDSTASGPATPIMEEEDAGAVADDSPSSKKHVKVKERKGRKSNSGKPPTVPRRGTKRPANKPDAQGATSEDEEEIEVVQQPPRKKTRLPKVAQQDSDDESVVAQPSSSDDPDSEAFDSTLLSGRTPKVLISSCEVAQAIKTWFRQKKADIVEDLPGRRAHFVCVVKDKKPLPATMKVLGTLVAGKPIVTDKWMLESKKAKELQALDDYIHPHLQKKGHQIDRRSLFAGKYVFFTNYFAQHAENFETVRDLVKQAGAISVDSGSAQKGHDLTSKSNVVLIGDDPALDEAAKRLIGDHGRVVYSKKMLGQCIIQGELDLVSEEFRLSLPVGG